MKQSETKTIWKVLFGQKSEKSRHAAKRSFQKFSKCLFDLIKILKQKQEGFWKPVEKNICRKNSKFENFVEIEFLWSIRVKIENHNW